MTLVELPVSELPRLEAWRARGSIESASGVDLFFMASKDFFSASTSNKPRLLLLHGYPTASFDFHKIFLSLEERFEVFCWDFCGYGFSEKEYKPIQEQIDLLETLLQQLGDCTADKKLDFHVLSHDLGDTFVQEMLARQLDDSSPCCFFIQSVVMLNGGILPSVHRPTLMQRLLVVPGLGYLLQYMVSISLFKSSISKVFGPDTKPTDQEIQEYYALLRCNGGEKLFLKNIQYMTERKQHQDRWVGALKAYAAENPFLLIDGPADPVSGKHLAEAVKEEVNGAKIVMLDERIGHWPQVEAPDNTIQAFLDFHTEIGVLS